MGTFLLNLYGYIFGKKWFYPFHQALFKISLKGMGFFNVSTSHLSGEKFFLQHLALQSFNPLIVFDVGSNTGSYAKLVRQTLPNATIFAFEPHPQTYQRLQTQANLHGYRAFNMGISNQTGHMTLYDYQNNPRGSTHASLHQHVIEQLHHAPSTAIQVSVTTVDTFMAEHQLPHIHILKIDTEGHELHVLQGATHALTHQAIDIIQFEFNDMNIVSRVFLKDFYDILPGYRFFRLLPHEMLPLGEYTPLFSEIFAPQNVVAIRQAYLKEREKK